MPSAPPPLALIVEDTPLVAALLARVLKSQGYRPWLEPKRPEACLVYRYP